MLASFILFDDGEGTFPEGVKVNIRTGFHIHDSPDQAIEEMLAHSQTVLPGKKLLAKVVVKVPDDAVLEAAELIEQEAVETLVLLSDEELDEMLGSPPPPAADWKQQYIEFATSFTEKLTAKVQASNNPFEVIGFLDDLFKEMAFSHQSLDPGQLAQEILAAAKDNAEKRKAQQWIDLGL